MHVFFPLPNTGASVYNTITLYRDSQFFPGELMMGTMATCSFERCSRKAWKPVAGEQPFCIFHSQKVDEKRDEFEKAWNEFLRDTRDSEGKLFNLSCRGFIIPINVNFSSEQFSGHTYFNFTSFTGHTYFNDAKFTGHIYFNSALFSGKTYFTNTTFPGKIYFNNAVFFGETSFKNAHFLWDAYFNSTQFKGETSFSDAEFSGETLFESTTFFQNVDFEHVVFSKSAHFSKTVFREEGFFTGSHFLGVDMSNSLFINCSFKNVRKNTHYNLKPIRWEKPEVGWQVWKYRKRSKPIPPTNFANIDTRGILAA